MSDTISMAWCSDGVDLATKRFSWEPRSARSRSLFFAWDFATGHVSKLFEEASRTRVETNTLQYDQPNIRVLGDGAELIWYSDRTGWGHLYLYDAQTGRLKNAITSGDWLVLDIQAVDEARREIYFTAVGRSAGEIRTTVTCTAPALMAVAVSSC